jgi:hypothetical protein
LIGSQARTRHQARRPENYSSRPRIAPFLFWREIRGVLSRNEPTPLSVRIPLEAADIQHASFRPARSQ